MATTPFQRGNSRAYLLTGRLLLAGLLISVAVMGIGLVLAAIRGSTATHVLPLDRVVPRLLAGDAAAILDAGILLLFATPLLGVVVALVAFAMARDWFMTRVTVGLLVLLAVAFVIALR